MVTRIPLVTGTIVDEAINDALDELRGAAPPDGDSLAELDAKITALAGATPPAPAAASTTVSGIVELATTTEAKAGTDTARAVTPAGLSATVDAQAQADRATHQPAFPDLTITYNVGGSPVEVTEDGITTTYAYNPDGTLHTATRLVDGEPLTKTYAYSGGNLVGVA